MWQNEKKKSIIHLIKLNLGNNYKFLNQYNCCQQFQNSLNIVCSIGKKMYCHLSLSVDGWSCVAERVQLLTTSKFEILIISQI